MILIYRKFLIKIVLVFYQIFLSILRVPGTVFNFILLHPFRFNASFFLLQSVTMSGGGQQLFRYARCNILGMIHVPALPGSPAARLTMPQILQQTAAEAAIYAKESRATVCELPVLEIIKLKYMFVHSPVRRILFLTSILYSF